MAYGSYATCAALTPSLTLSTSLLLCPLPLVDSNFVDADWDLEEDGPAGRAHHAEAKSEHNSSGEASAKGDGRNGSVGGRGGGVSADHNWLDDDFDG
jgi:hypothetical protein